MILVIIILVAWLVILGPNLLKRRSRTVGAVSSISHFHRQLRVLEHSAPQPLVTPAFRLRTVDGSDVVGEGADGRPAPVAPKLSVVGADQLPRPALAFLGEDPVASGAGPEGTPDPVRPGVAESTPRPPEASARAAARRRRRDTLGVLTLVFALTLLIGCIPGAAVAWIASLVSGVALTAYVAMLVRMRQMAEERERKLHYLRPPAPVGEEAPYGDLGLPVRISGRYAHPSNQAVAAR
jgi:hypothetical protein